MTPRAWQMFAAGCVVVMMASPGIAAVFPTVAGVDYQTSSRERPPTIGDWYTSRTSGSTDRMHRILVEITPAQLAAAGGTLVVTVVDAESNTPNLAGAPADEVSAPSDPTRFQLRDRTGTIVLQTATLASGAPNGSTATFTITAAGVYQVTSVTGAFPISGGAGVTLNDDDNSFRIDVPGGGGATGGLIGSFQGTFQQDIVPTLTLQMYFIVGPGTGSLALRNFDLDGCAGCAITYTRPSGANIAGTGSGNGVWNNGGSLNAGQDNVGGLTTISPGINDAGVWGLRIANWSSTNQIILEARDGGTGASIAIYDQLPTRAGSFTITPPTTFATAIGVPVDHAFTITNEFLTPDIINLTTSGTSVNWTAQLRNGGGGPLADTDGDGALDTGLLAAGGSVGLLLRITPNVGAVGPDITSINAISYMDTKVVPATNTTRSVVKTTRLRPAIAKAFAPASIGLNGVSTLTFTLSNPNTAPALTGANFTDTYPAGLVNRTPLVVGGTCTGVTHAATAGGATFNLTAANVPAAGSCTVTVQVTSAMAGSLNNVTSGVASNETGSAGAPSGTATLAVNPPLTVAKTSQTVTDPVNGAANPKAIPGAFVAYSIAVNNTGAGTIDSNTVVITDMVPAQSDLFVGNAGGPTSGPVAFVDGMPASGLTYTFASLSSSTDDVDFSSDGGMTYSYVPIPDASGTDSGVTHIRIQPKGPVAAGRNFVVRFQVRIE